MFVIVGSELYGRIVRESIYRSVFDSCTHGEGGDDFFSVYQTVSTDEYYFVLRRYYYYYYVCFFYGSIVRRCNKLE